MKDLKDLFVAYLVPRFVLRWIRNLRHPIYAYREYRHINWTKSVYVGEIVCDCRGRHLAIITMDGDDVILEDGTNCSLHHCCDPIRLDGSCHPYLNTTAKEFH